MKKTLFAGIFLFFLFVSSVQACINPGLKRESGISLNPFGGIIEIFGGEYEGLEITYNLGVKNINDQGLFVELEPSSPLKDYVSSVPLFVDANSNGTIPLNIWIGGRSRSDIVYVDFMCEDGTSSYLVTFIYLIIHGKEISPPPSSSCDSIGLDGCYAGMYRDYYCMDGELLYNTYCTQRCCQNYAGEDALCSDDRSMCLSLDALPPGENGNIAFLCKNDDCRDGIERQTIFTFTLLSWNVTGKAYDEWNETELDKYDIIACADQQNACEIEFNSLIYNMHFENAKSFIEIPDTKSAKAAEEFEYFTHSSGKIKKDNITITAEDPIVEGITGELVNSKYIVLDDEDLSSEVIDLADSGNNSGSVFFKVDDAIDHGRYAFVGWLYDSDISSITAEGKLVLNRTLEWLKNGNNPQPKNANIGFICSKDNCKDDNEMFLMKFFRKNGYSVKGQSMENSWTGDDLNSQDLILCVHSSAGCNVNELILEKHMNESKAFIEIPHNSRINAGYDFGYVSSSSARGKSSTNINPYLGNQLFDEPAEVISRKRPLSAIKIDKLNSVTNLAHLDYYQSTMFVSDAAGNKGRYAYIGWLTFPEDITEEGREILLKIIDWLLCGEACTGPLMDMSNIPPLAVTINSPGNKTYDNRKVLLNVSINRLVKNIDSIINGKSKTLCKDCSSYEKTTTFSEGMNELTIEAVYYDGDTANSSVMFTVDSKKPRIKRIYPYRKDYIKGNQEFTVEYDEDNLNSISLFIESNPEIEEHLLNSCPSGRRQSCSINVDLSSYDGQEIEYYFVVRDYASNVSSDVYSSTVDNIIPIVTVHSPLNETYDRRVLVNITASEIVTLEMSDNGSRFRSLCRNCDYYDRYRYFSYDTHNLTIRATDKAENEGFASVVFTAS